MGKINSFYLHIFFLRFAFLITIFVKFAFLIPAIFEIKESLISFSRFHFILASKVPIHHFRLNSLLPVAP